MSKNNLLDPKFIILVLIILSCTILTALNKISGEDWQAILVISLSVWAGVSRKKKKE